MQGQAAENVVEFLGGPARVEADSWSFEFGAHLASAWGSIYGGALGAACVAVGRELAPGLAPRSSHFQFLRQLPDSKATARGRVVLAGRTITTVEVQLLDSSDRLAVLSLITLVNAASLVRDRKHTNSPALGLLTQSWNRPAWPSPVAELLGVSVEGWSTSDDLPRMITGEAAFATNIRAPWRDLADTGPEVACVIADMCNGSAIAHGMRDMLGDRYAFPNTDLSLRFSGLAGHAQMVATATLLCVSDGTAIVGMGVHSDDGQLAHGQSTSVLRELPQM